ncbi:MAG: zinc ABC transporter substrate-binding protein [Gammaproteobacteria bacterium]|nr:zinc ABC transporter substrate-binding protein [Gammaproteobacteria bacterium]
MKKCFFVLVIFLSVFSNMAAANNQQALRVVTSFSILENLVAELGGNHVEIKNLVGRNSDAHIYQPKPSDAVAISNADLVIMNGLAFEGWIARLMDNNGYSKKRLVASQGVQTLMTDDDIDPHAWQSFQNIKIYINNISQALIELKPEYKNEFSQRNQVLMQKVIDLQQALWQKINAIPKNKRVVVTSHDAFAYLGREFDIQFIAPVGFNTDSKPTASDVAKLIDQIKSQAIKALFVENISNPRLLAQIASETDAVIGGNLYSDALSEMTGPAPTYLEMMRYNIESIVAALTGQEVL